MKRLSAYYFTARCLCLEIPENLDFVSKLIDLGEVDWAVITSIANQHLILPGIYSSFRQNKMLHLLPEELRQHLEEIHHINLERNLEILEQVAEINSTLNAHGISPVYTKGVAHLLEELYHSPGDRIMVDIDFLVKKEEMMKAAEILLSEGYFRAFPKGVLKTEIRKHYPRIIKEGRRAGVEIHHSPVTKKYVSIFSNKKNQKTKKHPKTRNDCYVLSDGDKLIHNFIHSQLEHKGHRNGTVYLKNLHDFYLLSKNVDVQETFDTFGYYKKHTEVYRQLAYKAFRNKTDPGVTKLAPHRFYHFRFRWNIQSRMVVYLTYFFLFIPPKIFRHYVYKPFLAIFNKDVRKHLLSYLRNPKAIRRHLASYRKVITK